MTTTNDNPFRNALHNFNLLPDQLKPVFLTAFNDDWSDLESNGNPLEHERLDKDDAIAYVMEWAGWALDPDTSNFYRNDPELTRLWLTRMADAYDLIPLDEPIESTFGGDHIATGHFIEAEVPSNPFMSKVLLDSPSLPDAFTITIKDDDEHPVNHKFRVHNGIVTYDATP